MISKVLQWQFMLSLKVTIKRIRHSGEGRNLLKLFGHLSTVDFYLNQQQTQGDPGSPDQARGRLRPG